MTPLERALKKKNEPKPCNKCDNSVRVDNVLYCKISGKIILPMFEDVCLCKGTRLKEREKNE